jgi:oxygen-independent coproporphyrinogen-3 oxidase
LARHAQAARELAGRIRPIVPHDTRISLIEQRSRATSRAVFEAIEADGRGDGSRADPVRSLYVHVPFCRHKCHYCDFYSFVDSREREGPFVDRLVRELAALGPWASGAPLRTIFVGGGTPTILSPFSWERILRSLHDSFDLSEILGGAGEFTVECNPETASGELFGVLRGGGVNRLSMGAQSFDPVHLKTLERWHDPASVPRAVELARTAGIGRLSVDLIFGIPGQTPAQWARDLDTALALGVDHLSCYDLTYEPNTAMTKRMQRGEFEPAEESVEIEMYAIARERTRASGLARYEVSNYARAGEECRHNLAYWRQEQWLAAGPSASAHVAGRRWKNVPRLDDYLKIDEDGFGPIIDFEEVDARRALAEWIMTGLRLAEGLSSARLFSRAEAIDPSACERLGRAVLRYLESGDLVDADGRLACSEKGFLLADGIAGELMATLAP